jgi:hypothetical protein
MVFTLMKTYIVVFHVTTPRSFVGTYQHSGVNISEHEGSRFPQNVGNQVKLRRATTRTSLKY